jgi:chemotaxis signal transduction protein
MARIAGQEFPVVDLVSRLGLPQAPHGRSPSIIAIEVETSFGSALVGFVADTTPAVIQVRERDFRRGRIRAGGRPRNVLDVDAALAPEFGGILP